MWAIASPTICSGRIATWRASAVGVYLGYAIGAVLAGVTADALGPPPAMWIVAGLTFLSGTVAAPRMTETLREPRLHAAHRSAIH